MKPSSSIPVVLVGCGAVSREFYSPTLRVLSAAGELSVHSLVDPSPTARAMLAENFVGAEECDGIAQAAAPPGSLAIIATPVRFHAEHACQAVARGWHVLCEKPMASTVMECTEMVAAAKRAQKLLAVGLYKRFFPSSRYLKSLFESRELGGLCSFSIAEGGPFKWPAATPSFFDKRQTPGGVLLDIGIHVLDLLTWWLGNPDSFEYSDDAMGGLETNSRLLLRYPNAVSGSVQLSRDWMTANEYRFIFERGIVTWKVNEANRLTVQLAGAPAALQADLIDPIRTDFLDQREIQATNPQSFIAQLRNVLSAIRGEESLFVSGEEGLRALRLIEECYRNRVLLAQPWLSPVEMSRAEELAVQS
jgi:predicted dehydrogenase